MRFVPAQQPAFRAFAGSDPPRFVNEVELECAKMLDYYGVPWEYEPTTFVLEPEAVDRLRAAAGKIILESPEFQRLLKDGGARIVPSPARAQ